MVLELKLLADVGLVGLPNAGKSTLLSAISAARPKIADYPFTTMEPQLGIVPYRDNRSFVMADIPGIIEGASEGKGLGLRFLRHIERNAVLLFMVPADADDIAAQYRLLLRELEQFNPQLMDKHRILAISKSDMLDDELIAEIEPTLPADIPHVFISAVTGQGLTELKDILWDAVTDESNRIATPSITHRPLDGHHRVREEDEFIFENTPPISGADEEIDPDNEPDLGRMTDEDGWDGEDDEWNYVDDDQYEDDGYNGAGEQNPHTIYGDEDPDDDIDPSTLTDDDWSRRAFEFGADEIDPDKLPDN